MNQWIIGLQSFINKITEIFNPTAKTPYYMHFFLSFLMANDIVLAVSMIGESVRVVCVSPFFLRSVSRVSRVPFPVYLSLNFCRGLQGVLFPQYLNSID